MSQRTITICDICSKDIKTADTVKNPEIPTPYIDAGVYGVQMHVHCFIEQTPFTILKCLGLDDIRYVDSKNESTKLIYTKNWVEALREG